MEVIINYAFQRNIPMRSYLPTYRHLFLHELHVKIISLQTYVIYKSTNIYKSHNYWSYIYN